MPWVHGRAPDQWLIMYPTANYGLLDFVCIHGEEWLVESAGEEKLKATIHLPLLKPYFRSTLRSVQPRVLFVSSVRFDDVNLSI